MSSIDMMAFYKDASEAIRKNWDNSEQRTEKDIAAFNDGIAVINSLKHHVAIGETTGDLFQDNLLRSGQVLSPEQIERLQQFQDQLRVGEAVLARIDLLARVGMLVGSEIIFPQSRGHSITEPSPHDWQGLPVASYAEIEMDPRLRDPSELDPFHSLMAVRNTPHVGSEGGMPLTANVWRLPFAARYSAPTSMVKALRTNDQGFAPSATEGTTRSNQTAVAVGEKAISHLGGFELAEIAKLAGNRELLDYVS